MRYSGPPGTESGRSRTLQRRLNMANNKYEITDIAHEAYPFLHRIRALRDVGYGVKAGDLGGFVEREENLAFVDNEGREDNSWIFDDAVCAGNALVNAGSQLHDFAVACGHAYITQGAVMRGNARAEDSAHLRGGDLCDNARISGCSMVLNDSKRPECAPVLSGDSVCYGTVQGQVFMEDNAVIFPGETCRNDSPDVFVINGNGRSVSRAPERDILWPTEPESVQPEKKEERPRKPRRQQVR